MIQDNSKSHRVRTRDSLTTQHLKEAVEQEALTLTTGHLQEKLVAESLTTAHLMQTLQAKEAQAIPVKPRSLSGEKMPISTAKTESK